MTNAGESDIGVEGGERETETDTQREGNSDASYKCC